MPGVVEFGGTPFNVDDCRVARLLANGTYLTTSVSLTNFQKITVDRENASDTLMAYGMNSEGLSVPLGLTGTLQYAAIDSAALFVMCGVTTSSSGSTPNQSTVAYATAGGNGLPYFGMALLLSALYGSGTYIGLYKLLLDKMPPWNLEADKFLIEEVGFKGFVKDLTNRRTDVHKRYETYTSLPTDLNQLLL